MDNKHTINLTTNDLVEYYTNQLLMDWIQTHQPELITRLRSAVQKAFEEQELVGKINQNQRNNSCQPTKNI
jgi:hypothetical protein